MICAFSSIAFMAYTALGALAGSAITWLLVRKEIGALRAALEAALIGERANRTMRDNARQSADNAAARLDQISKLADWRSP